ncbi:homoserine dehydrogenase [Lacrimispora xylanisolvens]|uniref:Homoserine dehydrogenase n=1 Tax=Lacrimispora xylanisolvens TaxID=384636 RepID=A0A2S6HZL0_9FIRM|nr:homoserine dehydrogenase [Hungatella xylanolytica]MBE5993664.1 homoserine dehydrogenase [Paenibacillaceae bacterium]PPK83592.1 homoserine dehydrogenase [Hungatella xylanolytica]
MMNVAVMGYGTIGSGVVEILEQNKDIIARQTGDTVNVKYILDLREFPGTPIEKKIVHDFSVIEKDPEVSMVIETMGGLNPAYPFVKASLQAGKHVATSNKALVAAYGTELLKIAEENQVNFLFEASVGGGIPIIRPLYTSLAGEQIEEITGILNGTTNYILTKMDKAGETFEEALSKAQELGYAERNPEADVEGHDTCRKIAILTALASGHEVNYEHIYTEGITNITDVDFRYADALGTSVKLFGSSRISDQGVHAFVAPVMIGKDHPLYSVNDVYNGILVKGNMLGTSMFYGSGAGKLPTASAVVADIIEALKNPGHHVKMGWDGNRLNISAMDSVSFRYFVRIKGIAAKRLAEAEAAFGKVEVTELDHMDEFAVMTEVMTEEEYHLRAKKLSGIRQRIRAEI